MSSVTARFPEDCFSDGVQRLVIVNSEDPIVRSRNRFEFLVVNFVSNPDGNDLDTLQLRAFSLHLCFLGRGRLSVCYDDGNFTRTCSSGGATGQHGFVELEESEVCVGVASCLLDCLVTNRTECACEERVI